LENLPLSATSQDRSVIDAVAFVLANQNARRTSISVDDAGPKEALNLSFVNDAWWPLVTQATVVRKLSSYARQNQTKKALWELDNIRRTIYILDFIDDPTLSVVIPKLVECNLCAAVLCLN
jgi:hypothetical protein